MTSVHKFLVNTLKLEQGGARIQQQDVDTLIILDCNCWGDVQTQRFKKQFPLYTVRCEANVSSLSGFVVILENKWSNEIVKWYTMFFMTLTIIIVSMHLLSQRTSSGII